MKTENNKRSLYASIYLSLPKGEYSNSDLAPFVIHESQALLFIPNFGMDFIIPRGKTIMLYPKPVLSQDSKEHLNDY